LSYDLAISPHGDLIMAGNRDLGGVSGDDLVSQRITVRLTVHRAAWYFDEDGTFGSTLYEVMGKPAGEAIEIDSRVREALEPMGDINIENTVWVYDPDQKSLVVKVEYSDTPDIDTEGLGFQSPFLRETTVVIPSVAGEGGGVT
jgi:hypothetical protein